MSPFHGDQAEQCISPSLPSSSLGAAVALERVACWLSGAKGVCSSEMVLGELPSGPLICWVFGLFWNSALVFYFCLHTEILKLSRRPALQRTALN